MTNITQSYVYYSCEISDILLDLKWVDAGEGL